MLILGSVLAAICSGPAVAEYPAHTVVVTAAPAPATEDGRYLPANTWVQLSTVPTQRFIPKHFTDCTQVGVRSNPVGRRGSSIVYGGDIFYFGGGGQSHPGNDIELFGIASNTWIQKYQPECLPACCTTDRSCSEACNIEAGVGTTEVTPLGRPYVEKPFQLIAYNPLRQKYTAALTSGLWEWDRNTGEWSRLTPDRPQSSDIATKMLVYDPDLQTVLYFATSGPDVANHTVFQFDYATNTWLTRSPIPGEISHAEIWSAYDSKEHKYLVSHGSGTMWIYEALDGTWTKLQNVPADVWSATSNAYDPISGVFVVEKERTSDNSVQLWTYWLRSDTWNQVHPVGGPPTISQPEQGNNLVYDDMWKRFYFLNVRSVGAGGEGGAAEGDVETWAYRIGGPVGPGDANCDGRVSAADLPGLVASLDPTTSAACGAVDLDRNGTVDSADILATVAAIFGPSQ